MSKMISSTQNSLVKHWAQLMDKSRTRRKEQVFILEGVREFELALKSGYECQEMMICESIIDPAVLTGLPEDNRTYCSKEVYEKLAYRKTTEGLLSKFKFKEHHLKNLILGDSPLILVAEAPEKPGNIGALLRTADAANIDAVIIANPRTDLYNPNIIRSSVGCVFTTQVATGSTEEVLEYLKLHNIKSYAAALKDYALPYYSQDFKNASAIIVGTEADGLTDKWLNEVDQTIIIPMEGAIDSMNVSVSASVLIFEAKRQRL
ncbi:MAG: TrmH family RNA methyltransferase [Flavobacteriaceae bacterium]